MSDKQNFIDLKAGSLSVYGASGSHWVVLTKKYNSVESDTIELKSIDDIYHLEFLIKEVKRIKGLS